MCRFLCFILFLYVSSSCLFSHPHVFIDANASIEVGEKKDIIFQIEWLFDDMFSAQIISEIDVNGDRKFCENETKEVERGYFSYLKNFDYFLNIKINNISQKFIITDFNPSIVGNKIKYKFKVSLNSAVEPRDLFLYMAFVDPTNFTAITIDKKLSFTDYFKEIKNEILPTKYELRASFSTQ